jgi:hypothetical protein
MISAQAQSKVSEEYYVKIAFIYNLARMVEWPENQFQSADQSFVICFLGKDPFKEAISLIKDKKIRGHRLAFKKNIAVGEASECHVVFIDKSERPRWSDILAKLADLPVLTVGDVETFSEQGGIINLLKYGSRIEVEVNLRAAKHAGFEISSRLLTLAKIVAE